MILLFHLQIFKNLGIDKHGIACYHFCMTDEERMAVHRQNVRDEDEYLTKLREAYFTALKDDDDETLYDVFDELEYYIPPVELFFELDFKNILFVLTNTFLMDGFKKDEYDGIIKIVSSLYIDEADLLLDFIISELNKGQLNEVNLKKLIKKLNNIVSFDDYEKVNKLCDIILDRARFTSKDMQKYYLNCCELLSKAKQNTLKRTGWKVIDGGRKDDLTEKEIEVNVKLAHKNGWHVIDGGLK